MDYNILKYLHGMVFLPAVLLLPYFCVLFFIPVGLVLSWNFWADKIPFDLFLFVVGMFLTAQNVSNHSSSDLG